MICVPSASDGTEEAANCTADSWRYQTADGEWRTDLGFPADEDDSDSPAPVTFEEFFNVTGDGEITVPGIPASIAPAMSDSLYGRTIQLNLTCEQAQLTAVVDEEDSCVLFQVEFSTYSPALDFNMALYRFQGTRYLVCTAFGATRMELHRPCLVCGIFVAFSLSKCVFLLFHSLPRAINVFMLWRQRLLCACDTLQL